MATLTAMPTATMIRIGTANGPHRGEAMTSSPGVRITFVCCSSVSAAPSHMTGPYPGGTGGSLAATDCPAGIGWRCVRKWPSAPRTGDRTSTKGASPRLGGWSRVWLCGKTKVAIGRYNSLQQTAQARHLHEAVAIAAHRFNHHPGPAVRVNKIQRIHYQARMLDCRAPWLIHQEPIPGLDQRERIAGVILKPDFLHALTRFHRVVFHLDKAARMEQLPHQPPASVILILTGTILTDE